MTSPDGHRYLISHTATQGGFCKIRCALDIGTQLPWAIKEFRLEPHRKPHSPSALGQPRTYARSLWEITEELRMTELCALGQLNPRETMVYNKKVMTVMPMMAADIKHLVHSAPSALKRDLCRYVFQRMARHGAALHQTDIMHGDIKLENTLYDFNGNVLLSDFGAAHECLGHVRFRWPQSSTYPSPEMVRGLAFGKRTDTWSLGARVGEFYFSGQINPFAVWASSTQAVASPAHASAPGAAAGRQVDSKQAEQAEQKAAWDKLQSFRRWRSSITKGRRVNLKKIDASSLWGRFFLPLKEADPALCHYALAHMLHPNPLRRADMHDVELFCGSALGVTCEQFDICLPYFEQSGRRAPQFEIMTGLCSVWSEFSL